MLWLILIVAISKFMFALTDIRIKLQLLHICGVFRVHMSFKSRSHGISATDDG